MRFRVTNEDQILAITDDLPGEAEKDSRAFTSREELHDMAAAWPMQRLIEIWNRLPHVRPVNKFENRNIAVARIWRAIQPHAEQHRARVRPSGMRTADATAMRFHAGSKAAQVCTLLERPDGATLDEIQAATGWQAHTVRGFLSRTGAKHGRIVRTLRRNGERAYRFYGLSEPPQPSYGEAPRQHTVSVERQVRQGRTSNPNGRFPDAHRTNEHPGGLGKRTSAERKRLPSGIAADYRKTAPRSSE